MGARDEGVCWLESVNCLQRERLRASQIAVAPSDRGNEETYESASQRALDSRVLNYRLERRQPPFAKQRNERAGDEGIQVICAPELTDQCERVCPQIMFNRVIDGCTDAHFDVVGRPHFRYEKLPRQRMNLDRAARLGGETRRRRLVDDRSTAVRKVSCDLLSRR